MKPYFSIIIPYHDNTETIGPLVFSIVASKNTPLYEIIIVDDGSSEEIKRKGLKNSDKIKILRFDTNKGPAKARNAGAAIARGKFLIFLDADVRLFPDALYNLSKIYKDDPDIVAVTGVWEKHQKSKAFFPNFQALRDWSYWINERDKSGYYFLFSTRIASIKREVFKRLKGFDEVYAGPLVEDIEFTYRIARRYAIIFAPNVRVHHEFEGFWPIAKKYFWRTYYWTKLYERRKKFDPVATTGQEAVTAISGVGLVWCSFLLVLSLLGKPILLQLSSTELYPSIITLFGFSSLFLFLFHVFLIRKFLIFVYQEKGLGFTLKSFFVGLILYCFITSGAVWAKFKLQT